MRMRYLVAFTLLVFILPFTLFGQTKKVADPVSIVLQSVANVREVAAMKGLVEKYKSVRPEITLDYRPFSGGLADMEAKILLNLSSGVSDPDIFVCQYSSAVSFFSAGWLATLPSKFASKLESNLAHPGLKSPGVLDGKWFGLPWSLGSFVLAYNKDHFREAGLVGPPKDYDQLMDYAKKLTKYDSSGNVTRSGLFIRKAGHPQGTATKWVQFYTAWGGQMPLFDKKGVYFNNKAARDSLQYYLDAIYKHKVDSFSVEGDMTGLGKGTTSMVFREPGTLILLETMYPDRKYGVFSVPTKVQPGTGLTGLIAVVNSHSKNKAAVWDFLEWLYQPENIVEVGKAVGTAILKQNLSDPYFQKELYVAENRQNVEHPESVFVDPMIPGSYEALMAIGRMIENVCYKKLSIDDALNAAEKEVKEIIQRNN